MNFVRRFDLVHLPFSLLITCWSTLICSFCIWNIYKDYTAEYRNVVTVAIDNFNKDIAYRLWAAKHGGVYVTVTSETPENPYLAAIPERDITTPSGKRLTLVNPSYLTRQVHELSFSATGVRGHLTSLKPLRQQNAPDTWEQWALKLFEKGTAEYSSLDTLDGKPYLRFMRPLRTEVPCLKCHAHQGYKAGDIRGGLSISVPWTPSRERLLVKIPLELVGHGSVLILGIMTLVAYRRGLDKQLTAQNVLINTLREREEELEESHNLLAGLSQQVPGLIYQFRLYPDGRSCFPYVSDAIREIYGVTPEQVRTDASAMYAALHPDDAAGVSLSIAGSARTMEPWEYEFRVVLPELGTRWRYGFARPEKTADGSVLWHGFVNDITDQKNLEYQLSASIEAANSAERTIREMEKFTRATLDGQSAHICVVDEEGTIIYTNRAWDSFAREHDITPDKTGKGISYLKAFELFSAEPVSRGGAFYEGITAVLDGSLPQFTKEFSCHVRGNDYWFDCKMNPFLFNGNRCAVISHGDITVRKRHEAELLKLSRAVEQSPVSIIITDLQADIEFVNPRFTAMTGYGADEVIGRNPRILKSAETDQKAIKELWATITGGGTWSGELANRRNDGTLLWERVSISPLRNQEGETTHYLAVCEDITDTKRLIAELHEAKELAESATRTKSAFLSSMSHEIRTPMNGVIGMASLLAETALSQEQSEFTEAIRKSGENLLDLINDILDFSKTEAGKLDLEIRDFNLRGMLEDAAELLSLRAAEKGLELICSVDPAIPECLKGDAGRVRQIITNLAGNAIKFTGAGEIVITASLDGRSEESATVLFKVRDTGIGIPADRLEAVFAPFIQADGSTTRKFGGTGLGLAISKQLAEIMGGKIGVVSDYGVGSTFHFTVCFAVPPQEIPLVGGGAVNQMDINGTRILVVDDNATCRGVLLSQLEPWGCCTASASDGESALEILREAADSGSPFRVVLIDQYMPGIDGIGVARSIKAEQGVDPALVLMQSLHGYNKEKVLVEETGFAAQLLKPVRQSRLHDCIAQVLGLTGTARQATCASPEGEKAVVKPHSARILLAEDNAINQKVAQKTLQSLGYCIDIVSNGREALDALEKIDYDLVLMDCLMPEMDGFEATATIRDPRSNVINHRVTVIAMTANAMHEDRERCAEVGMDDFLSKPVKKEVIAGMLTKWLAPSCM